MQAVVVARLVFGAEVCVFCFLESGVFHELLFDFDFVFESQTFFFFLMYRSCRLGLFDFRDFF